MTYIRSASRSAKRVPHSVEATFRPCELVLCYHDMKAIYFLDLYIANIKQIIAFGVLFTRERHFLDR